jgi:hypothetical protein
MIRPLAFAAVSGLTLRLTAPATASPVQHPERGSVHIKFVRYDTTGTDTGSVIPTPDGTGRLTQPGCVECAPDSGPRQHISRGNAPRIRSRSAMKGRRDDNAGRLTPR